ncbi:MAG: 4-hydroxy-tetrahydrodipicolinate reductase [Bacilli bacterium]|nr:4-hydroxy-tetrahydrodipicolinate reductase [Bacilli bacterium]
MINVLINGINGKMGQVLQNEINNTDNMKVVAGISRNDNPEDIKEKIDVIIDFSTPEGSLNILKYAKKNNIPVVIATTGFTEEQQKEILDYSKDLPIFQSSNMSFEINLMCDIVSKLAKQLTNSDIEIVEVHHRNKVDAPSGTALMLANSINEDSDREYVYDRHSKKQKRTDREIGISSIRGGTEVGKHTVYFFGDNESFEITHTVNSRSIFAKGAIKAAEYLINKPNGFYNMKDLIKED